MAPQLLVCVIHEASKIDEILEAFVDLGVAGATIFDCQGLGGALTRDVPLFAGFRQMLGGGNPKSKAVFSVIESEGTLAAAIRAIESICGDLDRPATGIVFTVPVNLVRGLRPEAR